MYTGLVSRQAVIEHLSKRLYETALNNVDKSEVYTDIAENRLTVWVDELPSVQPEQKTGRWIDAREQCGEFMCSNCQFLCCTNQYNYCPNCGAKMEV